MDNTLDYNDNKSLSDVIAELKNQGNLGRNSGTNSIKALKDILKEDLSLQYYIREDIRTMGQVIAGMAVAMDSSEERVMAEDLGDTEDHLEYLKREERKISLLEEINRALQDGVAPRDSTTGDATEAAGGGLGMGLLGGTGALLGLSKLGKLARLAKFPLVIGGVLAAVEAFSNLSEDEQFLKDLETLKTNWGPILKEAGERTWSFMVTAFEGVTKAAFETAAKASKGQWTEALEAFFIGSDTQGGVVGTLTNMMDDLRVAADDPLKGGDNQAEIALNKYKRNLLDSSDDFWNLDEQGGENALVLAELVMGPDNPALQEAQLAQRLSQIAEIEDRIKFLQGEIDKNQKSFENPANADRYGDPYSKWSQGYYTAQDERRNEIMFLERDLAELGNPLEDAVSSFRFLSTEDWAGAKGLGMIANLGSAWREDEKLAYDTEFDSALAYLKSQDPNKVYSAEDVIAAMDPKIVADLEVKNAQYGAAQEMRDLAIAGNLPDDYNLGKATEKRLNAIGYERVKGAMFQYQKGGDMTNLRSGDTTTMTQTTVITNVEAESGTGSDRNKLH